MSIHAKGLGRRVVGTLTGLLGLLIFTLSTPIHAEEPTADKKSNFQIHGFTTLDYQMRATSGGLFDHDLFQIFGLDAGDSYRDRVTAHVLAGYLLDLDGHQKQFGFYPLGSVYDNFNHRIAPLIYEAYVDLHKPVPGFINQLRIGQQRYLEFESLDFIGGKLDTKSFNQVIAFHVYGGVPVHTFEHFGGVDPGDWLVGSGFNLRPLRSWKILLDFLHVHDDNFLRPGVINLDSNLFLLRSWLDVSDHLTLGGKFSAFTDQLRDASAQVTWQSYQDKLTLQLLYYTLLDNSLIRPFEFDDLTIAGSQFPYHDLTLRASKIFFDHLLTATGAQVRKMSNPNQAGNFNHEFQRYFLTLSALKWPSDGTTLSVTGDFYSTFSGLPVDTFAVSGEIEQKFLDSLKLVLGTSYALYKFNSAVFAEDNDVRDYYGKVKWQLADHWDWHVRYAYETSSLNNIHSLNTGMTWSF